MNCIFCKSESASSRSVEHIIPESIGNLEHVLPAGVVCDTCNSYFSTKVEKPLLDTPYMRDMCFRAQITNKKGHLPFVTGLHLQSRLPVAVYPNMDGEGLSIASLYQNDEQRWIRSVLTSGHGSLLIPIPAEPGEQLLSRFVAKVALEALALRLIDVDGWNNEIIEKCELDPLREYARRGKGPFWPLNTRRIHPADFLFVEAEKEPYEVIHEWTFLYTLQHELYFVLSLFGNEYAINMGGPEIDGYRRWLSEHGDRSPLYPEGLKSIDRDREPHR